MNEKVAALLEEWRERARRYRSDEPLDALTVCLGLCMGNMADAMEIAIRTDEPPAPLEPASTTNAVGQTPENPT